MNSNGLPAANNELAVQAEKTPQNSASVKLHALNVHQGLTFAQKGEPKLFEQNNKTVL